MIFLQFSFYSSDFYVQATKTEYVFVTKTIIIKYGAYYN